MISRGGEAGVGSAAIHDQGSSTSNASHQKTKAVLRMSNSRIRVWTRGGHGKTCGSDENSARRLLLPGIEKRKSGDLIDASTLLFLGFPSFLKQFRAKQHFRRRL
jgi:hypothetical protein